MTATGDSALYKAQRKAANKRVSSGSAPGQLRVYHTGGLASPKPLAEAKSKENERTKAQSVGSNTPWAYRPGELLSFGEIIWILLVEF